LVLLGAAPFAFKGVAFRAVIPTGATRFFFRAEFGRAGLRSGGIVAKRIGH
jgi:hypothetical protein